MALAFSAAASTAWAQGTDAPARPNALQEFPPKDGAHLSVSSPAFSDGGDIPFENTQYRGNVFPGLSWTAGPQGTQTYVIIMQDTDAQMGGMPILHWTMYDIPAGVTKLDPAMPASANPQGSHYGPNVRGNAQPYLGPHTPPGPKHHYHLQVFALDDSIPPNDALSYDMLTEAMRGHILASGEVVGLAQADPSATPMMPPPPVKAPAPSPRPKRTG
jgi:para-nitrobenzyl esterase